MFVYPQGSGVDQFFLKSFFLVNENYTSLAVSLSNELAGASKSCVSHWNWIKLNGWCIVWPVGK